MKLIISIDIVDHLKVWDTKTDLEVCRLNSKVQLKKIKELEVEPNWNLKVKHSRGIALYNLKNNKSKIDLISSCQNLKILRNLKGEVLLSLDSKCFQLFDPEFPKIQKCIYLNIPKRPIYLLEDSMVLTQTNRSINIEDKELFNLQMSSTEDEDAETSERHLSTSQIIMFEVFDFTNGGRFNSPNSTLLINLKENVVATHIKLISDKSSQNKEYSFYVALESLHVYKITFNFDIRKNKICKVTDRKLICSISYSKVMTQKNLKFKENPRESNI